jgi:maltose-binding protein MalE
LYYNRDLLGDREPPRTVEEMLAMAKDVAPRNGYGLAWNSYFYWNAGYLGGFGAPLFDDDYKCILDQGSGAVDFLTFMKTMKDTPGVLVDDDVGNTMALFESGKAAMINDGVWKLSDYQEKLGQDKVGVAVLPAATYPAAPFLTVESVYVSAGAAEDQAAAAVSFAAYLLAPEQSQRFAEQFDRIPASVAVDLHADPARLGFMEQIKTAVPTPIAPEMGAVWEPANDMISAVLDGTSTPAQAVAEAVKRINEINKK